MAEFVQQNIEDMLPELEQMERVGLFSIEETRKMLKKRRAFEYKLQRRTRQKVDYLNYVQYEINALALVKKRREKTGYTFKRLEIDVAIIQRIHRLFKNACFRFQDDVKLWMSYIQFCQNRKEKSSVSKIYTRMLQLHSRKPALWIGAAKFEVEIVGSLDNARSLLQRGIRFNPSSHKLWHEYYRFELLNAEKLRLRREVLGLGRLEEGASEEFSSALLEGKVAQLVYEQALQALPDDAELVLGFLPICQQFDFTKNQGKKIVEDLKYNFPTNELTWEALARINMTTDEDESMAQQACMAVYAEAVKTVNTEKMWELYLNFCLECIEGKNIKQKIVEALSVFRAGCAAHGLSEKMYMRWVEVLKKTGRADEVTAALTKGTNAHPQSPMMWLARLQWEQIMKGKDVTGVFEEAVKNVPKEKSLPIWQAMLSWSGLHCPDETTVSALYERAITHGGQQVAAAIKPAYLQWAAVHKSNKAVRKLYQTLSCSKPLPVEFFKAFIDIQNSQVQVNMKSIRGTYESCVEEYGSSDSNVWLDYIRMEMNHPNGAPQNVGQLHWRAIKTLEPKMADQFTENYALLQNGLI